MADEPIITEHFFKDVGTHGAVRRRLSESVKLKREIEALNAKKWSDGRVRPRPTALCPDHPRRVFAPTNADPVRSAALLIVAAAAHPSRVASLAWLAAESFWAFPLDCALCRLPVASVAERTSGTGRHYQPLTTLSYGFDSEPRIVRPMLEAAGADIARVHTLGYEVADDTQEFDPLERLDTSMKEVERQIAEIGDVRELIIDPITDYVGAINFNRDDEVRRLMNPIVRLAAKYNLAVILIIHLNKKSDLPVQYCSLGGIGFRNVCKSRLRSPTRNSPTSM